MDKKYKQAISLIANKNYKFSPEVRDQLKQLLQENPHIINQRDESLIEHAIARQHVKREGYYKTVTALQNLVKKAQQQQEADKAPITPIKLNYTLLHYASLSENPEAIKILLKHGADFQLQDCFGETAMEHATRQGKHHNMQSMLEFTPKTEMIGLINRANIINIAIDKNDSKALKILLDYGATPKADERALCEKLLSEHEAQNALVRAMGHTPINYNPKQNYKPLPLEALDIAQFIANFFHPETIIYKIIYISYKHAAPEQVRKFNVNPDDMHYTEEDVTNMARMLQYVDNWRHGSLKSYLELMKNHALTVDNAANTPGNSEQNDITNETDLALEMLVLIEQNQLLADHPIDKQPDDGFCLIM